VAYPIARCVAWAAGLSWIALAGPASAAEPALSGLGTRPERSETWGGADVGGSAWSLYGGMAYALTGTIASDGWRLRAASTYGDYRYEGPRWDGRENREKRFEGTRASADLMLGYRHSFGPWIVKLFVGGTLDRHEVTPFDEENLVRGDRIGYKAALETWLTLGDRAFLQADASIAQPFSEFAARLRAGYRLSPVWSAGPEVAIFGHDNYGAGRMGAFARYEWVRGEISASGGVSGDRDHAVGSFGTVSVLVRF